MKIIFVISQILVIFFLNAEPPVPNPVIIREDKNYYDIPFLRTVFDLPKNHFFINHLKRHFVYSTLYNKPYGPFICYDGSQIRYIVNYDLDGKLDGDALLYPDKFTTISCKVSMGALQGECVITFRPFIEKNCKRRPFFQDSKFEEKFKGKVIEDGPVNHELQTRGFFRKGKKWEGDFMKITNDHFYKIVIIETYHDGQLTKTAEPKYYDFKYTLHIDQP